LWEKIKKFRTTNYKKKDNWQFPNSLKSKYKGHKKQPWQGCLPLITPNPHISPSLQVIRPFEKEIFVNFSVTSLVHGRNWEGELV